MPEFNNINFLTLPQQVSKNKRDIKELQDNAVSIVDGINTQIDEVNNHIGQVEASINTLDSQFESVLIKIEDTGWLPIYDVATTSSKIDDSGVFIRKVGKTVNIICNAYVHSYTDYNETLFTLSVAYRPYKGMMLKVLYDGEDKIVYFNTDGTIKYIDTALTSGEDLMFNIVYMTA